MWRQGQDDLIGVSKADAVEDPEPAVPFSHREDGNIADQELPIRRGEDLEIEGLEAIPDTLEPVLQD